MINTCHTFDNRILVVATTVLYLYVYDFLLFELQRIVCGILWILAKSTKISSAK